MSASDDRELERYLQRGNALSRAYAELKVEQPSPVLDQAVLARARDAFKGQPALHAIRSRGWPAITALAATVLLSFALVMRLALEPDSELEQAPATTLDSAPSMPTESAPQPDAERDSVQGDAAATFAAPPGAAPAPSTIEARRADIESEIRAASESAPAVVEPALPESVPGSGERAKSARTPAKVEPQPHADNDRARMVAPVPRQKPLDEVSQSSYERSMTADESAAGLDSEAATDTPMDPGESLAKEESTKSPEVWLEEIRRLRAAGQHEAAERELERFKTVYPDYLERLRPHESEPQPR